MRDIPGLEGRYAVTESGKVWSHPKRWKNKRGALLGHDGKFLTSHIRGNGYKYVLLRIDNTHKNYTVHRLVAITYIPNPNNKRSVNHIDGNKLNNDVNNLEWCTSSENSIHAYRTGLATPTILKHDNACKCFKCVPNQRGKANTKLTPVQVINIRHCRGAISAKEHGKLYGVYESTIRKIYAGTTHANV